ncbi:uncharacterized protein LOC114526132 [Dendronephthya gigantea]|uniref:uncharacterized protein LOC114526132 n=1 Tax=Dendronephthya gigantea TaxID=151771 RepID=UPI00106CD8B7|nr:uncharacterized protein LOC114526132 [Dendronephthya gigantea]
MGDKEGQAEREENVFHSLNHNDINDAIITCFNTNKHKNWAIGRSVVLTKETKEHEKKMQKGKDFVDALNKVRKIEAVPDKIDPIIAQRFWGFRKKPRKKNVLTLPNGALVTFGEVIALAGDYYGIPDAPIADPLLRSDQTDSGAHVRFKNAYATLALVPYEGEHKERLDKLLEMMAEDTEDTKQGCHHNDMEWDEATGGAWLAGLPIISGIMMKLAKKNYDHFLPNAKIAYVAGHEYAIEKAREGGRSREDKERLLSIALSIDAFACHFLTDAFSSGHLRTPRVELAMNVTPSNIGHLLCKYMHDEDNNFGLRVTNVRGDKWIAYGDGMLMKKCNKRNYHLAVEGVQISVDQIGRAFNNPDIELDPCDVTDLIPFVDVKGKNNTPLFQVKDGKLHRRSDINDLQDKKTITNWWGATTAGNLQWWHEPKNSAI